VVRAALRYAADQESNYKVTAITSDP